MRRAHHSLAETAADAPNISTPIYRQQAFTYPWKLLCGQSATQYGRSILQTWWARRKGAFAHPTNRYCLKPSLPSVRISLMRIPFLTLGLLALAIGLLWIGQGTGLVAWPRSSLMISQMQWAWYGAALAAVGLGLMWLSRR